MSNLPTLGRLLGEMQDVKADTLRDHGYTNKTNQDLAGTGAGSEPGICIAAVGFEQPEPTVKPTIQAGVAFSEAMADQGERATKFSFSRR